VFLALEPVRGTKRVLQNPWHAQQATTCVTRGYAGERG
jgi:hypothetical protein